MKELIDTFQMHSRIYIYLLEVIGDLRLDDITLSETGNVGEQFSALPKCLLDVSESSHD